MRQGADLVAALRELAQTPDDAELLADVCDERPEDLASALERLSDDEGLVVLRLLKPEQGGAVLVELPTEIARRYAADLPDEVLATYLDLLPMDDALDLEEEVGAERFESLLDSIPIEDAREIRRLRAYPENSVGRLMTEKFFEVSESATMRQILADLRQASEDKYETVNDIYVVDESRYLKGLFSLRKALRADPKTRAVEIMRDEPVVAKADEEAEEAARRMARYGFYALPVIDSRGRMVGIFTGDDAQTVLREAESQDVLALGAVIGPAESYLSLNPFQLYKRRIGWLFALFVAETFTGSVMRHYTGMGQDKGGIGMLALVPFIPLIIGAGGNSGSQVTTTITRALALGEVGVRDWALVLGRELMTAVMIGTTLGVVGFARSVTWWDTPWSLSLVVGLALPAVVLWAATIGSLLPLAAKRVGIDPAVMSAPFITTFVDATGLIIYFEIALRTIPGL
ncbi:MAG: magnesium transporter [Fimbriimonadaceae bacterium]|nr:magnesium transporter [Fimbriimonadaceae bacterium]QYK58377.1 MAG: magnesium transporter [Fimbriimonadaceae bacterium]